MSWSVSTSGKPVEVVKHLEEQSGKMTGQSKVEYDEALPHLVGLVSQNFGKDDREQPTVSVEANGHGLESEGKQVRRQCNVTIKCVTGMLMLLLIPSLLLSQTAYGQFVTITDSSVQAKRDHSVQAPIQVKEHLQAPAQKSLYSSSDDSAWYLGKRLSGRVHGSRGSRFGAWWTGGCLLRGGRCG